MQKYTSADTSINKVTRVYTAKDFGTNSFILDYGGGKFNTNKQFMHERGHRLYVYDPYNRSKEENELALQEVKWHGGADYVVCANVLNVIQEDYIVMDIMKRVYSLTKPNGTIYIQVYEGDKSGIMKPTTKGFQRNWKADAYIKFFGGLDYKKSGNIFTITKNR